MKIQFRIQWLWLGVCKMYQDCRKDIFVMQESGYLLVVMRKKIWDIKFPEHFLKTIFEANHYITVFCFTKTRVSIKFNIEFQLYLTEVVHSLGKKK